MTQPLSPAAHIVPGDRGEQPAEGQYVVDATFSALYEGPEAASPAVDIVLGTRLTVLGQAQGRYVPVAAPGRPGPLWADLADLAPAATRPAAAGQAPGDLRFFQDRNAHIDHVGPLHGPGLLFHASGSVGQVRQEPLEGQLAQRLAAVHRTLS
jgi:hypothetical protein